MAAVTRTATSNNMSRTSFNVFLLKFRLYK